MTVLKSGSYLEIPADGTEPGIKITYNALAPLGQQAFQIKDFLNAPIFSVGTTGGYTFGDHLGERPSSGIAQRAEFDADRNPAAFRFPDPLSTQTAESINNGMKVFSGTGAPSSTTIGTIRVAVIGDMYFRRDVAEGYRCKVGGNYTVFEWEKVYG